MKIDKRSKIYVAGHGGLIGTPLTEALKQRGYTNLVLRTHKELDLTRQNDVEELFKTERPEYVILNAAIPANSINKRSNPVGLMLDNILIIANIVSSSMKYGVKKLLYVCSIACYPAGIELHNGMLREDALKLGTFLSDDEKFYSLPKIFGNELCRTLNDVNKIKCSVLVIPQTYGINYHYENPERLPVFPALVKRFTDAAKSNLSEVVVWGIGNLRREMTSVFDEVEAFIILLENDSAEGIYNVGSGQYISVREMAEAIKSESGFMGNIIYDAAKPEANEYPLMCTDKIRALGWTPTHNFYEGVKAACNYYSEKFR